MSESTSRPDFTAQQVAEILPRMGPRARLSVLSHESGSFHRIEPEEMKQYQNHRNGAIGTAQNVHSTQEADQTTVLVTTTYTLFVRVDIDEKDREEGLEALGFLVKSAYETLFEFKGLADDERPGALAFGQVSGILTTWPMWREYAASCLSRMGVNGPPLYLITPNRAIRMASYTDPKEAEALDPKG